MVLSYFPKNKTAKPQFLQLWIFAPKLKIQSLPVKNIEMQLKFAIPKWSYAKVSKMVQKGKTQHCMLEPKTRVRSSNDSYMMDEERKAFSVAASLLYFDVKRKNCNNTRLCCFISSMKTLKNPRRNVGVIRIRFLIMIFVYYHMRNLTTYTKASIK